MLIEENILTYSSDPDALVFWSVSVLGTVYLLGIQIIEMIA